MEASNLDDVSAAIGYTATRKLQAWFAGRNVYIPVLAAPEHPLATIIGLPALRALVREFGGRYSHVWIPSEADDRRYARDRGIALRLAAGAAIDDIAAEFGLSRSGAERVRAALLALGWIRWARDGQGPGLPMTGKPGRPRRAILLEIFRTGEVPDKPPPLADSGVSAQ